MSERTTEEILNAGCNLIKAKTHEIFRRPEDNIVFVIDSHIEFDFGIEGDLEDAKIAAVEANNSMEGCANCKIYGQCMPSPAVITDGALTLTPAQRTCFD